MVVTTLVDAAARAEGHPNQHKAHRIVSRGHTDEKMPWALVIAMSAGLSICSCAVGSTGIMVTRAPARGHSQGCSGRQAGVMGPTTTVPATPGPNPGTTRLTGAAMLMAPVTHQAAAYRSHIDRSVAHIGKCPWRMRSTVSLTPLPLWRGPRPVGTLLPPRARESNVSAGETSPARRWDRSALLPPATRRACPVPSSNRLCGAHALWLIGWHGFCCICSTGQKSQARPPRQHALPLVARQRRCPSPAGGASDRRGHGGMGPHKA